MRWRIKPAQPQLESNILRFNVFRVPTNERRSELQKAQRSGGFFELNFDATSFEGIS